MTLLTIGQNVSDATGIERPSSIYGSSNETARRLLRLITASALSIVKRKAWSALIREHSITTVNGTASYALPDDFSRYVDDTAWDATNYWQMRGSLSPFEWQWAKRALVSVPVNRRRFRVKWDTSSSARRIFIDPTPTSADSLVLEYVSSQWCQSSGGTGQSAWAADTDTSRLDEELITLDTIWRFLNALGMPYSEEKQEAESRILTAIGQDAPAEVVSLAGRPFTSFTLPDGNYTL